MAATRVLERHGLLATPGEDAEGATQLGECRRRINPRAIKHQVSDYAKKAPQHRGLLSAHKAFLEAVVVLI